MPLALFEQLGESGSVWALVAAMAVFCWVLLRRSYRRFGRRPKNPPALVRTPRPGDAPVSDAPVPDEVARWEVRLHETARGLAAQLDTKMRALEALIRDADRAAARLEAARAGVAPEVDPVRRADDYRDQIGQLADYGFPAADIAGRLRLPADDVARILQQRNDSDGRTGDDADL